MFSAEERQSRSGELLGARAGAAGEQTVEADGQFGAAETRPDKRAQQQIQELGSCQEQRRGSQCFGPR